MSCDDLGPQTADVRLVNSSFEGRMFKVGECLEVNGFFLFQRGLFKALQLQVQRENCACRRLHVSC